MVIATIITEITFWGCLALGFVLRYVAKLPRLGLVLLAATPVVDLILLIIFYITLKQGGDAQFMHGFLAFYIAFSVVFGREIVDIAGRKFAGKKNYQSMTFSQNFKKCILACIVSGLILISGICVSGLSDSFWLQYWLIATVFTPLMWKVLEHFLSQKTRVDRDG